MKHLDRWTSRWAAHPLLMAALALALLFHGTLLALGSFRRTYDAYVHIFFADHYARAWFETWEPRWYTGFTVTSYPPGTHQLVALGSKLVGLEAAFVAVQLAGIALVILGVYRLTSMLGGKRTAGIAALLAVVATGIGQAVHVFGQLPTICALGMLLNSLPFVRRWIVAGRRHDLLAAVGLLAGTTALHHVTTLFGTVFFLGPVIVHGLLERFRLPMEDENPARPVRVGRSTLVPLVARRLRRVVRPLARAAVLGGLVAVVLIGVVLPYWMWSRTDPIVQMPIPHGSRASFVADVNAGLVFWLIPWGPMLLALPFAVWRGLRSSAWPFAGSLLLLSLLGTGGTTPLPRLLLGGAFEILTLDRFTFWATILVLPFAAMLAESLIDGNLADRVRVAFHPFALGALRVMLVVMLLVAAVFTVNLTHFRRMQPDPIDPAPIVAFLEQDQHWQWRYLTLGFGDQMAWLSAQTRAQSVDGNYHSARRLPELITTPVERLEGAKFRGVAGLGSLQQFLAVPEKYHLKFVFSNDQFYDPLLFFSGWRSVARLENGIVVWEREDVPPMPAVSDHPQLGMPYRVMWGVLPLSALALAGFGAGRASRPSLDRGRRRSRGSLLTMIESGLHRLVRVPDVASTDSGSWKQPVRRILERLRPSDAVLRFLAAGAGVAALAFGSVGFAAGDGAGPEDAVIAFYDDLDFRRLERAWDRLDPTSRPSLSDYLVRLSVEDGLLASYASLDAVHVRNSTVDGDRATVEVGLSYVTSLAEYELVETVDLLRSDGEWRLEVPHVAAAQPVERLARRSGVEFSPMGRRTVTSGTTEYDDVLDRPEIEVAGVRLVSLDGHPVAIGTVRNLDVDPASLTVTAQLAEGDGDVAATYNAASVMEHSLLPGETSPFRIDFEGVAGAEDVGTFDPEDFIPIGPVADLAGLDIFAKATVTGRGLARPVVVQDLEVAVDDAGVPRLSGSVLNLGLDDATVVALLVSLYDLDGSLIWVDWVLLSDAVRPGLATSFTAALTARGRLEPVEVPVRSYGNGLPLPGGGTVAAGEIPLPAGSGYRSLSVQPVTFIRATAS